MAENRGKDFEDVIRSAFESVPDTMVTRLPDPVQGYLGYRNICDFLIYHNPYLYCIECKSTHGNTLSIYSPNEKKKYGDITNNQWEGMLKASKVKGIIAGVICWWVDHDVTRFIPIGVLEAERNALGAKSIRYDGAYSYIELTGRKKRVFFDYDAKSFLKELENE